MSDATEATLQGDLFHRRMWKHYVLVTINFSALLILFYWVDTSKSGAYNDIKLQTQKLTSSSLILDKMMMELRRQKDKNYTNIYRQAKKQEVDFATLKLKVASDNSNPLLKTYAHNVEAFKHVSIKLREETIKLHTAVVDAQTARSKIFDKLVYKLSKNDPSLVSMLIELNEKRMSYRADQDNALKSRIEILQNNIRQATAKHFSQSNILDEVRSLLKFQDLEEKSISAFYKKVSKYSNSDKYKAYNDFILIYKNELESHDDFLGYIRSLLYLLIFATGFQFAYLLYQINKRNKHVMEQAEELKKGLDNQKELNELQRKFVSMVSHEFRTPLAIIDSGAQKMLRRADSLTEHKIKEIGAKIRSHINKLIELLDSTLHSQRMEAGAMELMLGPCDLKLIIGDVCQLQYEIHTRNTIHLDISNLPSHIIGDEKLIGHVITNLVSNGVKYSPDGTEVTILGRNFDDYIEIEIIDQGVGIPQEELAELFDCFYRASTSIGISGTGIGLHLVKNIIDQHNGEIEVTSTVGEGSTFLIRLPKKPAGYQGNAETNFEQVA